MKLLSLEIPTDPSKYVLSLGMTAILILCSLIWSLVTGTLAAENHNTTPIWTSKCRAISLVQYDLTWSCDNGQVVVWNDARSSVMFLKNESVPTLQCAAYPTKQVICKEEHAK